MVVKKIQSAPDALAKLQDAHLRETVEAGGTDSVSVILEVDLPRQQVDIPSRQERLRGAAPVARAVIAESPEQKRANADRVARLRELITDVIGTDPRWLASARAFTFHANATQLRKLAASELTRAIRSNRRLQP